MLRLPVLLHRVVHGVEAVQLPEQPLILPLHGLPRVTRQLAQLPVEVDRHAEHVAEDRAVVLRALAEKRRSELVELLQPMRRDALRLVLEAVERPATVLGVLVHLPQQVPQSGEVFKAHVLQHRLPRRASLGDLRRVVLALVLLQDLSVPQRRKVGPRLAPVPQGGRGVLGTPHALDVLPQRPLAPLPDAQVSRLRVLIELSQRALRANGVQLFLRVSGPVLAPLVTHKRQQLLGVARHGAVQPPCAEGVRVGDDLALRQEADLVQRHLEAVKLVRGGARVGVGVVLALDLRGKAARPALDQGGGLHRLLGIALIRFHGGGVGGRLVRDVLLGLQPPRQLHSHLQRIRVVVLHRAPVDVQIARVDLRVDHAVLAEGRALVLALLAVVELDHEEAVDLLDLSHAAVIPFCPAIFRPGGAVPGDALPGVSA